MLVATHNPDALLRVDLTTLTVTWTVNLPGTPTAVAAMATSAVVAGDTDLWQVTSTKATSMARTRAGVVALSASDEGTVLHVAESGAVEVFDAKGKLQRTLELGANRDPLALAAVPAGSSLYLGAGSPATPGPAVGTPGAIVTQKPPPTGTFVDAARDVAGSPPVQGAAVVAIAILPATGSWSAGTTGRSSPSAEVATHICHRRRSRCAQRRAATASLDRGSGGPALSDRGRRMAAGSGEGEGRRRGRRRDRGSGQTAWTSKIESSSWNCSRTVAVRSSQRSRLMPSAARAASPSICLSAASTTAG